MGAELGTVVAADVRRFRIQAGELLQHRHHVLGFAAPADTDRQTKTAVLVDHVQELEPPAIGGGVELEVHGPGLVGVFGLMTVH